jgi:transcription antitermination factor NusG
MTDMGQGAVPRWGVAPEMATEGGRWFVAIVNPNCHKRASGELRRIGYRAFFPFVRRWVSHARTKRAADKPLLGRYLFVYLPDDHGTERARTCNGVEGFVSVEGMPVTLPAGPVEALISRQISGEWNFVDHGEFPDGQGGRRTNEQMPIGARVRIIEGELEGLLATLISQRKGKCSVKLVGTNITKTFYPVNLRAA